MSINNRIKHIIRATIIILMTGYFGIIAVLNIPFIQQKISAVATRELGKFLKTEVQIGNIDLGLLNRIIIQNVFMEDQNGKDMVKISRLSAKFDIPSLLHGQIRIHSVQLFGLNAHIYRPTLNEPSNIQFVLDAFAAKDTLSPKRAVDLRINSVLVRRGEVHYNVWSEENTPGRLNPNHLCIQNLSATLSLKALNNDSLHMQIKRLSFNEQSGFKVKKLAMKVTGNRKAFHAHQVELNLPESTITADTLSAIYGDLTQLVSFQEHTRYLGKIRAHITPYDFRAFAPELAHFKDAVNVCISAHGKGGRLECSHIEFSNSNNSLLLKGQAMFNHLDRQSDLFLFGKISELHLSQKGCMWLFRNLNGQENTPDIITRLGNIHFKGDISGIPHQLTTQGTLTTNAGMIQANVTMYTDTLTQGHSYSGKIFSDKLNLGTLLNQKKSFGETAFNLELKGFKYHNGKAESYIKGVVSSFMYNQYEYKNITLDGHYQPGGFNGKISLNDPNGNIDIEGRFATRQQIPDFNLKAQVRNFKPHMLNLTPRKFKNTDFSVDVIADFTGNSIDDMKGDIRVEQLHIKSPEKDGSFFMDKLIVSARNLQELTHIQPLRKGMPKKQISITSPFIKGEVTGYFSYRTITASILKMIQKYAPSLLTLKKELPETQNDFNFHLQMEQTKLYQHILNIPLTLNMPATITGYVNDPENRIQISGYLPEFIYDKGYFESGTILCDNLSDELKCQVRLNKRLNKGAMLNLAAHARMRENTLNTTINWGNNTSATFSGKLKTTTRFRNTDEPKSIATEIQIHPSDIILNEMPWRVHPAQVNIQNGKVYIHNFLFEHKDQHIKANGTIGPEKEDSCLVELQQIDLKYVMELIQFHAVNFDGLVSGKAHFYHLTENPDIRTRLQVEDFCLNQALLGKAAISGYWDKELEGISLKADIVENESFFTKVEGYISPKMKGLDLHIKAGGTNLAFLHKFIDNIFPDIQGRAFGKVRLFGPFSQLDLEGYTKAKVRAKVGVLNTYLNAETDSVLIRPGHFHFKNVTLYDNEKHRGTAEGELNHTKLKDLSYRFRFNTNNMLVYHTEKETLDFPFFGKIYTTGNILLHGGNNALNVDGKLRTDPQTSFTYVTATAAEATNSQFITFVDKTPHRKQEEIDAEVYHYLNQPKEQKDEDEVETDIHLNLQIETTPAASMRIVMDPMAGDNITARGNGNLQINFYNKGDFQMFGNYNIEEGLYKMSLQNIIRKDFILQPGGLVSFNGNPKRANLNVQAAYTVNSVSLNDLIPGASASKSTIRVNCLLNLNGDLTAPALHFDLDLPTVNDEDRELVHSLTNTEEQMNTQIIYLLTIGKFYTYDYANNANQSDATSSLAFNTLSGQLNNMLSQVIDNQNWNLGTNLSTGEKGWGDVEAEAILSGRLLNNRLLINGNFGYRDNPMRNTNFVGDFEAMWLLTKNGEFRLKGYNQTNDRYFTKSTLTTQGIGFMYKKDFTRWRELIDWMLLKNRRNRKQNEQTDKPTSTNKYH